MGRHGDGKRMFVFVVRDGCLVSKVLDTLLGYLPRAACCLHVINMCMSFCVFIVYYVYIYYELLFTVIYYYVLYIIMYCYLLVIIDYLI